MEFTFCTKDRIEIDTCRVPPMGKRCFNFFFHFQCGSTEHTSSTCNLKKGSEKSFSFATCYICKESGHISRQCPDNPRGLYPKGGACRGCGSVEHLAKDCPDLQVQLPPLPHNFRGQDCDTLLVYQKNNNFCF